MDNAIGEGVDVIEIMGENVNEGPRGVARIEPNPTEQLTVPGVDVPVGVIGGRDAGQLDMTRELFGEFGVVDQSHLLREPTLHFLLADERTE